jgi:hypothetical protein
MALPLAVENTIVVSSSVVCATGITLIGASLTAVTVIVVTAVLEFICPSLTVTLTIRLVVSGVSVLLAKPI